MENKFSVVRSMGGSHTHPNPLEFAIRIRAIKITNNVKDMLSDKSNVKLAMDDNTDEPYLASEIGKYLLSIHYIYIIHVCTL